MCLYKEERGEELDFANRLREIRRERHLTQEQLGDMVGVSRVSIGFYEHGRVPPVRVIEKLAEALIVPVNYLISGPGTTPVDETRKNLWLELSYTLGRAYTIAKQIAEYETTGG